MLRSAPCAVVALGLGACLLFADVGEAQDIRPLERETRAPLNRPSVFHGAEHWQLREGTSEAHRIDAADGMPARCTFTLRMAGYFADPTIESLQIGLERNPTTSRWDAFDGTMFIRVRFVDTTTWRPIAVEGLIAGLDRKTFTTDWRVDPPDADGYMMISKPTVLSNETEKRAFGGLAAVGDYRIRIARATGAPVREYFFDINRVGYLDEAVFDNIDCLKAMGDDPVTLDAVFEDDRLRVNPVQVPPSRMRGRPRQ